MYGTCSIFVHHYAEKNPSFNAATRKLTCRIMVDQRSIVDDGIQNTGVFHDITDYYCRLLDYEKDLWIAQFLDKCGGHVLDLGQCILDDYRVLQVDN
jgi:hypothetical protein